MAQSKTFLRRLMSPLIGGSSPYRRRRVRRATPTLDTLEGRVVMSGFGGAGMARASRFAAQVSQAGATGTNASSAGSLVTGDASNLCGGGGGGGTVQDFQLAADQLKLRTDLSAALAGSTVTDAQRLALRTDLRAIADAGITVDRAALRTAADTLLTAIATGADQAAAQAAFTAAFAGPSGAALTTDQSALVSKAYADFATVARGLNLDSTELDTLAADRAAIQADKVRLGLSTADGQVQPSNLDLILSPGLGLGLAGGRGRRGRR